MSAMASPVTSLPIVYSTVYSGADQRKHQSSASLAFVRGIHRWSVNSPHKGPVTRKISQFDDVIMDHVLQCHSDHRPMFSPHMKGRLLLLMNCHFLSWYIFSRKFHLFSSSFQSVQYVSADDSTKNKLIVTFYVLLPFISTSYLTITQYVLTIDALQGKSFTVSLQ